ncbi:hypothetical protein PVAR5_5823 [Paecilomyces variotii No. 5]|uniref:Fungal N-terminal domain-containing protein n=1 Tax=Byssochlamys spectabilis (strain No. 5 / NBRC 109023) TaxID=1356009 RepID=V5G8E3_BYSSN|nr:hypothetical protein PVAR5_5823 [Paecilomyces variotii No. 5]
MTDTGSVAPMLGVANAGFRLSLLLNAVACQIASSGIEIHSISKGVSLFALALKHVGKTLRETEPVHSAQALAEAREITDQGYMILNEIEDMLDRLKASEALTTTHGLSVQQRVRWCFKKHRVTYLLSQLECLKLSLAVMLQILQLGKLIEAKRRGDESSIDDEIAQERADTQNMVIVRYWSLRRLDRLRHRAEQEARETEHDPMNSLMGSDPPVRVSMPSFRQADSRSRTGEPVRIHVVSLADLDASMGAIHDSPKGMIQCSDRVINSLLHIWTRFPDAYGSSFETIPDIQINSPTIDSESDDDSLHSEFDGHEIKGYYLEGTTDDWRKPHSQQAREHAAKLRKKYSKYQAQITSDSDGSESSDNPSEQKAQDRGVSSAEDKTAPRDIKPPAAFYAHASEHGHSPSSPSHREPHRRPRPDHHHHQHYHNHPRPLPIPRSTPQYYQHSPQERSSPHLMSSSPAQPQSTSPRQPYSMSSSPHTDPQYHYTHRSSHHARPRDSRDKHVRIQSPPGSGRESRDDRRERHKNLKRSATRGLLGISAAAGFMDALEAFHIV